MKLSGVFNVISLSKVRFFTIATNKSFFIVNTVNVSSKTRFVLISIIALCTEKFDLIHA